MHIALRKDTFFTQNIYLLRSAQVHRLNLLEQLEKKKGLPRGEMGTNAQTIFSSSNIMSRGFVTIYRFNSFQIFSFSLPFLL